MVLIQDCYLHLDSHSTKYTYYTESDNLFSSSKVLLLNFICIMNNYNQNIYF